MSECNHDCSSCSQNCAERKPTDFRVDLNPHSSVKKVIAIVSGKGGVGKSLVSSMLAVLASRRGLKTAVLDADITGPSIPKAFGIKDKIYGTQDGMIPAKSAGGIDVVSLNLMIDNDTDPVIWRGPVIAGVVKQFWSDVVWQDEDVMFIDMPPGTGDVTLTVFQSIPVDGIVIVTSPQELVGMIVEKAVKMAQMMNVPVLAVAENMSYVECPGCGEKIRIFGEGNAEAIAKKYGIEHTAAIPIDPKLAKCCDEGRIEDFEGEWLAPILDAIEALPQKTQK